MALDVAARRTPPREKRDPPKYLGGVGGHKENQATQKINLCQELRQTKNLAEIIGGDESE
jgi:hypothetical protein